MEVEEFMNKKELSALHKLWLRSQFLGFFLKTLSVLWTIKKTKLHGL
jgi:hypothetical protein